MSAKRRITVIGLLGVAFALLLAIGPASWYSITLKIRGRRTVEQVANEIGPAARDRLKIHFDAAGISYPPGTVTLLAIKDDAQLEFWVGSDDGPTWIQTYPIKALSGTGGPKLREGDLQVPEGIYQIEELNSNSRYHLSLKLNYPNAFDLRHAEAEGRREPGSDIFIHGKAVSIGCLAMGDMAIEELFILAHDIGHENFKVVISPSDPRTRPLTVPPTPTWVGTLYKEIEAEFHKYVRKET